MSLGQYGHLELRDCAVCQRVCKEVAAHGADCTGNDALPRHACFPCAYAAGENFNCPAFRRYGFDCSGAYPGIVVPPAHPTPGTAATTAARPHGSRHRRRPSSITAAAWPLTPPNDAGPRRPGSLVRAPPVLEPWPSVGIIGIPRGSRKNKTAAAAQDGRPR